MEVHVTLPPPANKKDREANLNRKECKVARQIEVQTPRGLNGWENLLEFERYFYRYGVLKAVNV